MQPTDIRSDVLLRLSGAGWSGLRGNPEAMADAMREAAAKARDEIRPFARMLATDDGRAFLAWFTDWLVLATLLRQRDEREILARTVEEVALLAREKQGENNVAWMILQALQNAKEIEPIGSQS